MEPYDCDDARNKKRANLDLPPIVKIHCGISDPEDITQLSYTLGRTSHFPAIILKWEELFLAWQENKAIVDFDKYEHLFAIFTMGYFVDYIYEKNPAKQQEIKLLINFEVLNYQKPVETLFNLLEPYADTAYWRIASHKSWFITRGHVQIITDNVTLGRIDADLAASILSWELPENDLSNTLCF